MDRAILNEFKPSWEEALEIVGIYHLVEIVPRKYWLIAVWLFVLGCPENACTYDVFVYVICSDINALEHFDVARYGTRQCRHS